MSRHKFKQNLTGKKVALIIGLAVLFGAPAAFMLETRTGPAAWLVDTQQRLLGGYFPTSSFVVLLGFEFVLVLVPLFAVAIGVKRITGKTLVEVFRKGRSQ